MVPNDNHIRPTRGRGGGVVAEIDLEVDPPSMIY